LFGVLGMVEGDSKKFLAIKRNFFDMVVEGGGELILRTTGNGICRKVLLFGFLRVLERFCASKRGSNWSN